MRWFWVDRFTEYVAGSHAVASKGVSLSDDFIHSHWESYPVMPNSLIAEGMAQTAGLLVSEIFKFQELVVLAKFTRLSFDGPLLPGETIEYRAEVGSVKDFGAQASVVGTIGSGTAGERVQSRAEIFFGRLANDAASGTDNSTKESRAALPTRLFDPEHLCWWLHITGVFNVGVHADGSRMMPADYGLPVYP
ncbi:MAG: hypothetical protein AAGG46_01450 [Planctomycetota bacterium]